MGVGVRARGKSPLAEVALPDWPDTSRFRYVALFLRKEYIPVGDALCRAVCDMRCPPFADRAISLCRCAIRGGKYALRIHIF